MITHDEARETVDRIYVHTDWETKDKLLSYISQQEKVTELLGLKNEQLAIFQFERNHFYSMTTESYKKLAILEKRIEQLEKELGEMK